MLKQKQVEKDWPEYQKQGDRHQAKDGKLQIARRIDWRFLLPNPQLSRVAYLGTKNVALLEALEQFSDSLTAVSTLNQLSHYKNIQTRFDLVVLHSPDLVGLERANSLLTTGSYLYWEIDRSEWIRSLRKRIKGEGRLLSIQNSICTGGFALSHFRRFVEYLERFGYTNIQISWHRPNFDSCLEIIPLDDPLALSYVFSRISSKLSGQIKSAIGRLLMRTDLLGRFIPCLSLIAHKPNH